MRIGRRRAVLGGGALLLGGCGKSHALEPDAGVDASAEPMAAEPPPRQCPNDLSALVFASDRRTHTAPAASVFYSWTTPEQAAEIRKTKRIFTRDERPGLGPGYAMDLFASFAGGHDDKARIATALSGSTFSKARYAWTTAWATRMGWPGESYGNELLRIELRPEAYIVTYVDGRFGAVNLANEPVPLPTVLADPTRIGAIYFVQDRLYGPCDVDSGTGTSRRNWTFGPCPNAKAYREYILGSDAMVASFSHRTEETRAEIDRGRVLVAAYRQRMGTAFTLSNDEVLNHWQTPSAPRCLESDAYIEALAIPSSLYEPTEANLDAIVRTLAADLFTPNPFVVRR